MRVLVTGAAGFIGRQVLPILARVGFEVHAISRTDQTDWRGPAIEWHRMDLFRHEESRALVKKIAATHMLHLAWYTEPGRYWNAPINLDWAATSLALLSSFVGAGGRRAVFSGTCAEYDWTSGLMVEEVTPCAPASQYGRAKLYVGELCREYARASAVSFAWGRIFHLYGPGEPTQRLVPSIIWPLLSSRVAKCSTGLQIRDFLHVEDVAAALVAILVSDVAGPVNIGSGEPKRVRDVVLTIGDILARPDLIAWGTIATAQAESKMIVADNSRLLRETDWHPQYDLRSGLANTIDWWRASRPGDIE